MCTLFHSIGNGNSTWDKLYISRRVIQNGQAVNGSFNMNVYFYDAETNGNFMNSYNFSNIPVVNGLFTLNIDIGYLTFFQDKDVWLELNIVDIASTTFPRQLITNTPFAIYAQSIADNTVGSNQI